MNTQHVDGWSGGGCSLCAMVANILHGVHDMKPGATVQHIITTTGPAEYPAVSEYAGRTQYRRLRCGTRSPGWARAVHARCSGSRIRGSLRDTEERHVAG